MNNRLKQTETVAGLAGGGKGESPSDGLSAAQELALAALLEGATITEAATRARVSRVTLWRWKGDALFVAEWNRRKAEIWEACAHRLAGLCEDATECVRKAIVGGDSKVALEVLRGAGFLGGKWTRIGPTTPEGVVAEKEKAEAWERLM